MSIADELAKFNTFLSNAYAKCEEKGATIPDYKNLQNLEGTIDSIKGGAVTLAGIFVEEVGNTEYEEGASFSLSGYTITAVYSDGTKTDVTGLCTVSPSGSLKAEDTIITISYAEGEIVRTVEQRLEIIANYCVILYDSSQNNAAANLCEDSIGGGWYASASYFTEQNDGVLMKTPFETAGGGYYRTNNPIDLSEYVYGYFVYGGQIYDSYNYAMGGFSTTANATYSNVKYTNLRQAGVSRNGVYTMCDYTDLSSYSGNYYMSYGIHNRTAYKGKKSQTMTFAAIFKKDKWDKLGEMLGLSENTIANVLASYQTILSNEEFVDYMIANCTGELMGRIMTDSSFRSAIINSGHKTKFYANEHWYKALYPWTNTADLPA